MREGFIISVKKKKPRPGKRRGFFIKVLAQSVAF